MTQHAPLIIDIAGLSLTKADRRRLNHPLTGGIILFGRNWKDRQQLTALCAPRQVHFAAAGPRLKKELADLKKWYTLLGMRFDPLGR